MKIKSGNQHMILILLLSWWSKVHLRTSFWILFILCRDPRSKPFIGLRNLLGPWSPNCVPNMGGNADMVDASHHQCNMPTIVPDRFLVSLPTTTILVSLLLPIHSGPDKGHNHWLMCYMLLLLALTRLLLKLMVWYPTCLALHDSLDLSLVLLMPAHFAGHPNAITDDLDLRSSGYFFQPT